MSGGRSSSTPTPPQPALVDGNPAQTNGEIMTHHRDESSESADASPPPPNAEVLQEHKQESDCSSAPNTDIASQSVALRPVPVVPLSINDQQQSSSPPPQEETSSSEEANAEVSDTVDAPVGPSVSLAAQDTPVKKDEPQISLVQMAPKKEQTTEEIKVEEPVVDTLDPSVEGTSNDETVSPSIAPVTEAPEPAASTHEAADPQTLSEVPSVEKDLKDTVSEKAEPSLPNGFPQDIEEITEEMAVPDSDAKPLDKSETSQSQEPALVAKIPVCSQVQEEDKKEDKTETSEATAPPPVSSPTEEYTMQAATSVPKKKKSMKELNKKEAIGTLLDAFTEEKDTKPPPELLPVQADPVPAAPVETPPEAVEETWEEREDKQNEVKRKAEPTEPKYQYKEEQWKPINPEAKKRYDREFLLGFQFSSASMNKPEGLPLISDVVLDKANKTPLRPADPARLISAGPDFTPSYLGNLGSRSVGGPRGPPLGPRRSQQGQRKEPRKIISSINEDIQLNKAEKAWKPSVKKPVRGGGEETEDDNPENAKTQEVLKRLRSILNKLTPQRFQELMKQVQELPIDTEERLKGAIDLIFEKAILEPNFSVAYANMCRGLLGLKVPTTDKSGGTANFRKLLLNRCQKEFEKDQDDDEIFEKKQKELDAAKEDEERDRLKVELEEARDKARRRSLGNIKFIGELFKLKMLTEAIMHDCVVKLLKNHDEESLECLCRLLSTIGKDLDFEKAKPRMDQYFNQMDKIIKERKTSSRIRFMLQDVLDLRRSNWVPRRAEQGPKTIDQIHKEAEMEEHREQIKVQQQLLSKKEGGGGRMSMGGRGPHTPGGGRVSQPQDEGWNTVPISKPRPIDTTRLSKITKSGAMDFSNQLLAPGGKGMFGSWGKGSSGGSGTKPSAGDQDSNRPATSTLNRFSALQSGSSESDRRAPQRSSSSRERGGSERDRFDRREGRDGNRGSRTDLTKRSFSRESKDRGSRGGDGRGPLDSVRRVASMTDDRGSRDRGSRDRGSRDRGSIDRGSRDRGSVDRGSRNRGSIDRGSKDRGSRDRASNKDLPVKREGAPLPSKPALTEEEVEKKSNAIIEEYLHINDLKEALQCVAELSSASLLFVFVRVGLESTLERSTIAREHMGLLLHQLIKAGTLLPQQYYKGLHEILEVAEDMEIDIPHIWRYLAELITPMLHESGLTMGQLFREISKPLVPLGKAGVLLVQILKMLCKGMTPKKVGAMWIEADLNWKDYLPSDVDVNKFVTEQEIEYTLGEEVVSKEGSKKTFTGEELGKQLDRLLQDKANNQRIRDWIEANLDEQQTASNSFIRALMTSVCQSAIICDNPYKLDAEQISGRATLLQRYLYDEQKELQALYALQALMVHMEQPANLLRMFFDALYDEDVIKEEAFYKWESSKDPAEQTGKGVALKSVTAFFTWLREAEEESDKE